MTSLKQLVEGWAERFEAVGLATPMIDARALTFHVTGLAREDLIGDPDQIIKDADLTRINEVCEKRLTGVPVAYLTGVKEFWSLDFKVTSDTLIPRPDTETLVMLGLEVLKDRQAPHRILDLGTGSGCLLLALLSELPKAQGLGIDVSQGALDVAQENARQLGLSDRAEFQLGNWCEGLEGPYDLIVSNPPYIADEDMAVAADVRDHEPAQALFGGADGLDPLRLMAPDVRRLLTKEGSYIMEYGQGQTPDVTRVLESEGFEIQEIRQDLAGIERAVLAKVAKM